MSPQVKLEDKGLLPQLSQEMLETLIPGPVTPEQFEDIFQNFKKAFMERALNAEMNRHLGYRQGEAKPAGVSNHRNGKSVKTVITDTGEVRIDVPRERDGTFEPQFIGKHQRRLTGFDDKILAMYARGMTVREIQGFLQEMYGMDVSPDLISTVTDEVISEIMAWQTRALETMYPVVFFDALRVKIRADGVVRNKAVYLALGVLPEGTRDILGIWIENTEGAKFWMKVFNDLKTRGCNDILIAVTDGLNGMSEALSAVYPQSTLQTCIVHLIRNSLDYANWKERRSLAAELKVIYTAVSADAAERALEIFEQGPWGQRFPAVVRMWRSAWDRVIPFFSFPPDVRRVIYTTNAIESVNARVRKILKSRSHFPSDEAATKLIWLTLRNIIAKWTQPSRDWKAAMNQFAVLYKERFTRAA